MATRLSFRDGKQRLSFFLPFKMVRDTSAEAVAPARACARARGHRPVSPRSPFLTRQATPMRSPLSLHNENVAPTESPMGVKLYPFPPPTPTDANDADADEPPPPPPPATVINETTFDPVEVQPGPSPAWHEAAGPLNECALVRRRNSSRCLSFPTSTLSRSPYGSAVTLRSRSPTCSISTRSMLAHMAHRLSPPHGTWPCTQAVARGCFPATGALPLRQARGAV